MIKSLLYIFLGGGLGSALRYLIAVRVKTQVGDAFPWGTLTVNIIGSFIIGALTALALRHKWFESTGRDLLIIGFCGGFTTFSTLALESHKLIESKQLWSAGIYVVMSVGIGLCAIIMGMLLIKRIYT